MNEPKKPIAVLRATFDVHLYATVRVSVKGIAAPGSRAAVLQARESLDLSRLLSTVDNLLPLQLSIEDGGEALGYRVDELAGDAEPEETGTRPSADAVLGTRYYCRHLRPLPFAPAPCSCDSVPPAPEGMQPVRDVLIRLLPSIGRRGRCERPARSERKERSEREEKTVSHVTELELYVQDLAALKAACPLLGLEFRENQQTYRWYGRFMGDAPLPKGFTRGDLGKCEHAIAVPGERQAYEIGMVRRRDGKPGYALLWDNWNGGFGLEERIGPNGFRLNQEYAAQLAARHLQARGYRVERRLDENGVLRLLYFKDRVRISLDIEEAGWVRILVEGSPGPSCKHLTAELERALGRTVTSRPTREMGQRVVQSVRQILKR